MYNFEVLKNECSSCFIADAFENKSRKLLAVVPNLELNGAQVVFDEMLDLIIDEMNSYEICIISPEDGPYREYYLKKGRTVLIKPFANASMAFRKSLQSFFSTVILNTALVHYYLMYFINTEIPVFWWIHESEEQLRVQCADMPNPYMLSDNIHIYGVSHRVRTAFENIYSYSTEVMHLSVADKRDEYKRTKDDERVTFVLPAAYSYIKGQDIMLEAIISLPEEYKKRARFLFCGYMVDGQRDYYDRIVELSSKIECVEHLGRLNKGEMYQLYTDSDCVVAPSRLDSTPTTIVEAMMFGKITIASVNCGISEYMRDCVNGFVFEDIEELMKRLLLVIADIDNLGQLRERGREIWKTEFSREYMLNVLRESGCFL